MRKITLTLSILTLFSIINTFIAQNQQRIEIEAKVSSDKYYMIPVGKEGIIIFSESDEKLKETKEKVWLFTKYNTDFKEIWNVSVPIVKNLKFNEFIVNDKNIFLIFKELNSTKNKVQVFKMDVHTGDYQDIIGVVPNSLITDVSSFQNDLYFGGATAMTKQQKLLRMCGMISCWPITLPLGLALGWHREKESPLLYKADFKKGNIGMVNLSVASFEKYSARVMSIETDDKNGKTSTLLAIAGKGKDEPKTLLRVIDRKGELENKMEIKTKMDYRLLEGNISLLKTGEKLIIGTYGTSKIKKYKRSSSMSTMYSQGLYLSLYKGTRRKYMKYYNYVDIPHFLDYLPERYQKKLKNKVAKKKKKGKEIELSYKLLVHDIIEQQGEFILIGEAYYPEYHYETRCCDSKGNSYSVRVFDGYRYTHALVAGFDDEGELKWSEAFPMDVLSYNLIERVAMLENKKETIFAYSYGGEIISMRLGKRGMEKQGSSNITNIETGKSDDKVKTNYGSDMMYWYGDYFISYGYQKIKTKGKVKKGVKKKRSVFYMSKINLN